MRNFVKVTLTEATSWDMQSICSVANALVRCGYVEDDVLQAIDAAVSVIPRHRFSAQGVALVYIYHLLCVLQSVAVCVCVLQSVAVCL